MSQSPFGSAASWEEAEVLIHLLRQWGIFYLMGETRPIPVYDQGTDGDSASSLILRLARCPYPRMRDASISLFLLHPELAPVVLEVLETYQDQAAEQVATLVLASLYLQRYWSVRLLLAGYRLSFPETPFAYLWHTRDLPAPSVDYGEWGLRALQAFEQHRTGLPFNFLDDWHNQVAHLLLQQEAEPKQNQDDRLLRAAHVLKRQQAEQEQECLSRSMRPMVDRQKIEQFLHDVGDTSQDEGGRLYVVDEAELIHAGLREGATWAIDVEVSDANLINKTRQIGQHLTIPIRFSSPGDVLPLPQQWQAMSQRVGRYGSVEVYYFDFSSLALAKLNRGSSRDIGDVQWLVQQQIITLLTLDRAFEEVLAQMGQGTYVKLNSIDFARNYQSLRPLL